MQTALDSIVHRSLLLGMIDDGAWPTVERLATETQSDRGAVVESLHRLQDHHAAVLHPGSDDPWVVHPFSSTPTLFYVEGRRRGWWAPCIWCALGVATLVGEAVSIHTRLGAERDALVLRVDGDRLDPRQLVVHFATPVARAWENVHAFCACTLVFANEEAVADWCARHGRGMGAVVPLADVLRLARAWYGRHLDPNWRKPSGAEARDIFTSVGLTGPAWEVPASDTRF